MLQRHNMEKLPALLSLVMRVLPHYCPWWRESSHITVLGEESPPTLLSLVMRVLPHYCPWWRESSHITVLGDESPPTLLSLVKRVLPHYCPWWWESSHITVLGDESPPTLLSLVMRVLPHYCPFLRRFTSHTTSVMQSFDVFVASRSKLWNKESSCRWLETPWVSVLWRQCSVLCCRMVENPNNTCLEALSDHQKCVEFTRVQYPHLCTLPFEGKLIYRL